MEAIRQRRTHGSSPTLNDVVAYNIVAQVIIHLAMYCTVVCTGLQFVCADTVMVTHTCVPAPESTGSGTALSRPSTVQILEAVLTVAISS